MEKLCVLNIGHSENEPGASSADGVTEFDFNSRLAKLIEGKVKKIRVKIVSQTSLRTLPDKINALNPTFTISLHCNAANTLASGTETLCIETSTRSIKLALILQRHLVNCLGLPDRGAKTIGNKDRGGFLLWNLLSPAIIAEPFFIDNPKNLLHAQQNIDALASAYAAGIDEISDLFVD